LTNEDLVINNAWEDTLDIQCPLVDIRGSEHVGILHEVAIKTACAFLDDDLVEVGEVEGNLIENGGIVEIHLGQHRAESC
jgi:hypothetical protein